MLLLLLLVRPATVAVFMTHVFLRAAVASTATAQGFCWLNGINRCMQSSDSMGFRNPPAYTLNGLEQK